MTSEWERRFLELADLVATWSKDPGMRVGAVIVRPDRTVASVGYNGFPRGMPDNPAWLRDREEKLSRTVHAEINALLHTREPVRGYTLFSSFLPCDRCFVQLAQAGIAEFHAPYPNPETFTRWLSSFERTRCYAQDMNLKLVEHR